MSFLRHKGNLSVRSLLIWQGATEGLSLPLIVPMSFPVGYPWRVALQQSSLPFHQPRLIVDNDQSKARTFFGPVGLCLNFLSHEWGAPHLVVLLVGVIIYLMPLPIDRQLINYLVLPFVAMVAIGVAVYPVGMYEALSKAVFTITDDYIEEESGIIWKRTRRIPLSYVRDVTYDQNFIQAIFGVSDITVSTTNGEKIVLNTLRDGMETRDVIWRQVLSKSHV